MQTVLPVRTTDLLTLQTQKLCLLWKHFQSVTDCHNWFPTEMKNIKRRTAGFGVYQKCVETDYHGTQNNSKTNQVLLHSGFRLYRLSNVSDFALMWNDISTQNRFQRCFIEASKPDHSCPDTVLLHCRDSHLLCKYMCEWMSSTA